eukprot:gene25337-31782_t
MAMGLVAEASIPADLRWLPMGMDVKYLKKATGKLVATSDIDPQTFFALPVYPGEVSVPVDVKNAEDKHHQAKIFHIQILTPTLRPSESIHTLARERGFQYNPRGRKEVYIALHETQSIDFKSKGIKDLQLVTDNLFAAVGQGSIMLYTRKSLKAIQDAQLAAMSLASQSQDDNDSVGSNGSLNSNARRKKRIDLGRVSKLDSESSMLSNGNKEDSTKVEILREFSHTGTIPMAYNALYKSPSVIRQVDGLNNTNNNSYAGTANSYLTNMSTDRTNTAATTSDTTNNAQNDAQTVDAVVVPPKLIRCGVLVATSCPWAVLSGGSGERGGYMLELITIGSDNRLAHWGVRQKDAHGGVHFVEHNYTYQSADQAPTSDNYNAHESNHRAVESDDVIVDSVMQLEYPMEVDLLGEYNLPQDPTITSLSTPQYPLAPNRVIVTACAQGVVKVWKLETDCSLTLIAFLASPCPQPVQHSLASSITAVGATTSHGNHPTNHRLCSMIVVPSVEIVQETAFHFTKPRSSSLDSQSSIDTSDLYINTARSIPELGFEPPTSAALELESRSHSTLLTVRSHRSDKRQFVSSMESMQRIVSSELHFAKKDQRLLELFTQSLPAADGTISPSSTVDIVFSWLNTDRIGTEAIWQLFKLLEIQEDDRLKFIEVAKIAAVVASAMNRTIGDVARSNFHTNSLNNTFQTNNTRNNNTATMKGAA